MTVESYCITFFRPTAMNQEEFKVLYQGLSHIAEEAQSAAYPLLVERYVVGRFSLVILYTCIDIQIFAHSYSLALIVGF